MRLTTRTRYGLRALASLAAAHNTGGKCAREIADEQNVSKKYLESILAQLRASGLVRSVRGAHGGYILAREPEEMTVADVVRALEGSLALVDCVDDPAICADVETCSTRRVWVEAEQALTSSLEAISISSLAKDSTRSCNDGA